MTKFSKPAETNASLIRLMEDRGLSIGDKADCGNKLNTIGYYRLSAYMLPFQKGGCGADRHHFIAPVTFDEILELYIFDRKLRLLVLDGIERIEVAFRAALTDSLAVRYGAHWFMQKEFFEAPFNHAIYLENIRYKLGDGGRTSTVSVQHYFSTYSIPNLPPSWMVFEAVTMGTLATTIRNLQIAERKRVARCLNLDEALLRSWCLSLSSLRNHAAHHERIWNRTFAIKPQIAKAYASDMTANSKCYAQLVTMQVLLRTISPLSSWNKRLMELLRSYPGIDHSRMGFPSGWETRPLWC